MRLLTIQQLRIEKDFPFSRQYIGQLVREGVFPKPIKTPGGQINLWVESEVDEFIERMRERRDTEPPDPLAQQRVANMLAARAAKKAAQPPARPTSTVTVQRRKRRE